MSIPLQGHPGVETYLIEVRAFSCPRCAAEGDDRGWPPGQWGVPLADGQTIVCRRHATAEEARLHWCETCRQVLDQDAFDLMPGEHWRYRRSCRACRAHPGRVDRARPCARCGAEFAPSRADARFCSGRCRVAAHRARPQPPSAPA